MRKVTMAALLGLILATGCETETAHGPCKGVLSMDERDPALSYQVSTRNVVLAAIFSPSLIWPAATAALWLWCPTSRTAPPSAPGGSSAAPRIDPHGAPPAAPDRSSASERIAPHGARRGAPERSPAAVRIAAHGALRHG